MVPTARLQTPFGPHVLVSILGVNSEQHCDLLEERLISQETCCLQSLQEGSGCGSLTQGLVVLTGLEIA